jgi:hypothetical protein
MIDSPVERAEKSAVAARKIHAAIPLSLIEISRIRARAAQHIAKLEEYRAIDASAEVELALIEWREILRKFVEAEGR